MQTLTKFKNFVDEINKENSRLYKISILEKYKEDEDIKYYLNFIYNPYIVTGISTKKLNKETVVDTEEISVRDTCEYLLKHNTGRDYDIAVVNTAKSFLSEDLKELFSRVITKDLQLGIDTKTINKVIPNLIPEFNVQLAEKYFENPEYVEGKEFAITRKIDGCRIIALKENGKVNFYTRQGQKYDGLVDLEKEMLTYMPDNICLDGELTLLDPQGLDSGAQYKATTKLCRTKDTEKHGLKMLVFDYLPAAVFKAQNCPNEFIYSVRRNLLTELFKVYNFEYFNLLPVLYSGSDTNKITELLNEQVAAGEEGIMVNLLDATYKFKRTKDLLKCKLFNSADLRIVGFESGINKYENTLGALLLEYKDGIVKCGSGFSDEQRAEFWNNKNKYLNSIVEITYFEETNNAEGGVSLRFPIFKDFRPDKSEPNY